MNTTSDSRIDALAETCVDDMGDIFWDFDPSRDTAGQYTDPRRVALEAVKKAMGQLAQQVDASSVYPASLREEYKTLVAELPEHPTNRDILVALMSNSAWTERGGQEVVQLVRALRLVDSSQRPSIGRGHGHRRRRLRTLTDTVF